MLDGPMRCRLQIGCAPWWFAFSPLVRLRSDRESPLGYVLMKLKLAIAAGFAVLVGIIVILVLNASGGSGNAAYPVPNGYNTLRQATEVMTPLPTDYGTTQDTQKLADYVAANEEALKLIDQALQQECVFPLAYCQSLDEVMLQSNDLRNLTRLLLTEARIAELEGRSAEAADLLADGVLLGHRIGRGGLMVHQLIASASQSEPMQGLMQLAPKLSADQKTRLLKRIEAEVRSDESIEDTLASLLDRERAMVLQVNGPIAGRLLLWQMGGSVDTAPVADAIKRTRREREDLFQSLSGVAN